MTANPRRTCGGNSSHRGRARAGSQVSRAEGTAWRIAGGPGKLKTGLNIGGGMSETAESILAAVMTLPDVEREALTIRLMDMLPSPGEDDVSDADFAAELLRRKTEMEQGLDEGILWSQLKDMD